MMFRAAVLSIALSASVISTPLVAQFRQASGDLVPNNVTGAAAGPESIMDKGSMVGTVTTSDNHAAADARVEVHDVSTGAIVASGYVNPNGTFALKNLPRGTYEVVATSGISEGRERVRIEAVEVTVNLMLPHTDTSDPGGAKSISVAQLQVPEKARHEVEKAREFLQKSNFAEAKKHVEKSLAIEPRYADAIVLRGVLAMQQHDLTSATQDFTQALRYDPSSAMAYTAMGAIYNVEGKYEDALRELDRSIALSPTSWQAQFELAKANLGKGDFEAALQHASKAQVYAPSEFPPIYLVKGHALLGMKDYTAAIAQFEAFLSKDGQSPEAAAAREQLQEAKSFVNTTAALK